MPFNLGRFLKRNIPTIASAGLGFLTGGPAGLGVSLVRSATSRLTRVGGGAAFTQSGLGGAPAAYAAAGGGGLPMVMPMGRMAALMGGVRLILNQISMYIGRRITGVQVVALIKQIGIEAAAVALGVSVAELIQVWATQTKRRRGRGISARDIRRTKSTLRKLSTLACAFSETSVAVRPYARRRGRPGCKPCP